MRWVIDATGREFKMGGREFKMGSREFNMGLGNSRRAPCRAHKRPQCRSAMRSHDAAPAGRLSLRRKNRRKMLIPLPKNRRNGLWMPRQGRMRPQAR